MKNKTLECKITVEKSGRAFAIALDNIPVLTGTKPEARAKLVSMGVPAEEITSLLDVVKDAVNQYVLVTEDKPVESEEAVEIVEVKKEEKEEEVEIVPFGMDSEEDGKEESVEVETVELDEEEEDNEEESVEVETVELDEEEEDNEEDGKLVDLPKLTYKEFTVMVLMPRDVYYNPGSEDASVWTTPFLEGFKLDSKVYNGVLSSLEKKGLVGFSAYDEHSKSTAMYPTDLGKLWYKQNAIVLELDKTRKLSDDEFLTEIRKHFPLLETEGGKTSAKPAPKVEPKKNADTPKTTNNKAKTPKPLPVTVQEFEILAYVALFGTGTETTTQLMRDTKEAMTGEKVDGRAVACYTIALIKKQLLAADPDKTHHLTHAGEQFLRDNGVDKATSTDEISTLEKAMKNFKPTAVTQPTTKTLTPSEKEAYLKGLKKEGIKWEEHPHPAINLMRAKMAEKNATK